MDKLHFASAEVNSMSKQAVYRKQVEDRIIHNSRETCFMGNSRVRLSDLTDNNKHIIHAVIKIK